jgi:hypothetical protein
MSCCAPGSVAVLVFVAAATMELFPFCHGERNLSYAAGTGRIAHVSARQARIRTPDSIENSDSPR